MVYRVVFTKQAAKSLQKMSRNTAKLIREKLDQLSEDPYRQNPNLTKLQNRPGYRLRVGDWRIIYELQNDQMIILALKIASRGEIYR